MINALVFDSKEHSLQQLENCLNRYCPEVSINGKINNLNEINACLKKSQIHLLFIDSDISGAEIKHTLNQLRKQKIEVIILSNLKQFAYEAFKLGAVDFLLKPIDIEELKAAIKRIQKKIQSKQTRQERETIQNINYQLSRENLIGIPTLEGFDFIKIKNIIRCEGLQRCTQIVTTEKKVIVSSYNLGEFKRQLEPYGFFSPHRSHLINLNYIKKYIKDGSIIMQNDASVPVSRRKKTEFLTLILHV